MPITIFLDDRFLAPGEEPKVSLFDRGYLFGDTIFETLRAYGSRVFALDEHVERLTQASAATGITLPREPAAIAALIADAVGRCGAASTYVRVTVSRGVGGAGIGTIGCDRPVLSIVARELASYPASAYAAGVETRIVRTRRVPAACLDPSFKAGNYLPNIMARREIEAEGLIEGIQLAVDGQIASGMVSNVFFVFGDALRTPDDASGCRPGVTRAALLRLAPSVGLRPEPCTLSVEEIARADEAFFANTLMECLPIRRIGADLALRSAEDGSVTRRLHAAYRAAASGRD